MKELNIYTKQAQHFIGNYEASGIENLNQCYKTYSYEKCSAFRQCENKKNEFNGYFGRIIAFNSYSFTYAFMTNKYLIVITPSNEYKIKLV